MAEIEMKKAPVDAEKVEQEIRSLFYQHEETCSCVCGLHGYMASDGAPCYSGFQKPPKPEYQLKLED